MDVTIEEFGEGAFEDSYGDEYQDQIDMNREEEKNNAGVSDNAYGSARKATRQP